ncbi:hypothetical protein LJR009_001606 [Bosea sp. LjRoot9]|uniref:phage head-tail joining protein n=1 Tax=Bosea sp. LjRoot9 TaxID=3342341 RepID=UPI003ECF598C
MAWTQSDIDALKSAIATGVKKASFGSGETRREQEFRSLAEMKQTLADMIDEVAGTNAVQRTSITQFTRD